MTSRQSIIEECARVAERCEVTLTGDDPHGNAQIASAIRSLSSKTPEVEDGWRDIKTAPRDGTRVDLWLPTAKRFAYGFFYDDHYRTKSKPRPYWRTDSEDLFGVAWQRANQPTHWRPLPPPPSSPS